MADPPAGFRIELFSLRESRRGRGRPEARGQGPEARLQKDKQDEQERVKRVIEFGLWRSRPTYEYISPFRRPAAVVMIMMVGRNYNYNLKEIHELLAASGETEVNLIIRNQNKQAIYSLQNNRKFDLNHLKALKSKDYVEKITV